MDFKEIKSIKIIHDIDNRIEFIFLAEFFRLCGIYVGEYIHEMIYENREICAKDINPDDQFDVDIYVGKEKLPRDEFGLDVIDLGTVIADLDDIEEYYHIIELSVQSKLAILKRLLLKMVSILEGKNKGFDYNVFVLIGEVYVEKNLTLYCANIQYYRMQYEKQSETAAAFSEAYKMLKRIEGHNADRHIVYAKLYCASKTNSACFFGKYLFEYKVEELARECNELIKEFPDFSNARVLLGLIYQHSLEYTREAVSTFEAALRWEKDYSYASHIYYWIAKRYESYEKGKNRAKENYEKAYNKKKRFRNIYKLAMMCRKAGEYEKALEYIDMILMHMEVKLKKKYMDPLEIEYYYKVNSSASQICCASIQDYDRAIRYGENAVQIHDYLKSQRFYDEFYREESNEYRELSKRRMNLNRVYQYLAISYGKQGKEGKSNSYWKKMSIV